MDTIGERLKYCREQLAIKMGVKKISAEYVAKQALGDGDKQYNILNWESGRVTTPPVEELKLMAEFYEVPYEWLKNGAELKQNRTNQLEYILSQEIFYDDKIITPYEKQFLLNTLKMLRNKE